MDLRLEVGRRVERDSGRKGGGVMPFQEVGGGGRCERRGDGDDLLG